MAQLLNATRICVRSFGIRTISTAINKANEVPEKSVFISQSSNIFRNLALEDWLYKNLDFSNHQVLFLWRNDPCVVIGRHQNPWIEANIPTLKENDVALARRNSGGGTVYHDRGNLNCTFFTPRDKYNRKKNLDVICQSLKREWGLEAEINCREDVTLNGYKLISGTASKLGRNAYHHCTILINANLSSLKKALHKDQVGIKTNATSSTKSSVMNIQETLDSVTVESALAAVGWEYLRTDPEGNDGGKELLARQRGFKMINPTDSWFPGLDKIKDDMENWDWVYGKTPKFTITRSFHIPQEILGKQSAELTINVEVQNGLVENIHMHLPPEFTSEVNLDDMVTSLKGQRFCNDIITQHMLGGKQQTLKKNQFVAKCMEEMVLSI